MLVGGSVIAAVSFTANAASLLFNLLGSSKDPQSTSILSLMGNASSILHIVENALGQISDIFHVFLFSHRDQ